MPTIASAALMVGAHAPLPTYKTRAAASSDLPDESSLRAKNISPYPKRKSALWFAVSSPPRGALRDRHECWAWDAMDALASPDE